MLQVQTHEDNFAVGFMGGAFDTILLYLFDTDNMVKKQYTLSDYYYKENTYFTTSFRKLFSYYSPTTLYTVPFHYNNVRDPNSRQ